MLRMWRWSHLEGASAWSKVRVERERCTRPSRTRAGGRGGAWSEGRGEAAGADDEVVELGDLAWVAAGGRSLAGCRGGRGRRLGEDGAVGDVELVAEAALNVALEARSNRSSRSRGSATGSSGLVVEAEVWRRVSRSFNFSRKRMRGSKPNACVTWWPAAARARSTCV